MVVCLEQGADKLYDLYIGYKFYDIHAIFIPDYQYFYVSLGNNFLLFFVEAP